MFLDKIRIEDYIPEYNNNKPLYAHHIMQTDNGRYMIAVAGKRTFPDRIWKNVKEGLALFQIYTEKETYQFATGTMFEDLLPALKPYTNFSDNKLKAALKNSLLDQNFDGSIDGVSLSDLLDMSCITIHIKQDADHHCFMTVAHSIFTNFVLWVENNKLRVSPCPIMDVIIQWNLIRQTSSCQMRDLYTSAFLDDNCLTAYSEADVNKNLYDIKMRLFMGANSIVKDDYRVTCDNVLTEDEQDLLYEAIDSDVLCVKLYEDGVAIPAYNSYSTSIHLFSKEELQRLCSILEKLHKHIYQHIKDLHKAEYIQYLRTCGLL